MSGMELDSNFLLKKCGKRCAAIDRISQLPDEIITHILSFLPLKEAVATSILSQRWSSLWKYTPNLIFINNCIFEPMISIPVAIPLGERVTPFLVRGLKNVEWVNLVLNSYKALSLKQLTISFYVHQNTFHQVSKWLHFAFSRRVESLKLDFGVSQFVLDINILSSIQCSDYKFLKELTLESLDVSGEVIEFLQRNCLLLERLIMRATLTSDVVFGGTLKYLEICPPEYRGKFIKISALNLTRLICNCFYELFFLENVPNLVHASFYLSEPEDTMHKFANAAAKLEILTLFLDQPKAFRVPPMPKLKKLVLDYSLVDKFKKYLLPVTCLLEASPCLEEFKLEISDLHKYYYQSSSIFKAILKVPKVGGFQHYHLKVFEFSGFCHKAADNVALVRYIANNCVVLEEIIITPISIPLARQFILRDGSEDMKRKLLSEEVDVIAEEQQALDMKKSTEKVLAGRVPDHIKLLIN